MDSSPDLSKPPTREQPHRWRCFGLVVFIASIVFFTHLGQAQLWDRDEPRNAGCAVEMLQRGDWIVPMFNDELRFQKPVLLYWLMMSAFEVFGISEFSARFWSALLGVGTVAMTYALAYRLFDSSVAFLSGIILSSNIMFAVAARAATPDSALMFFSTMAIGCYVWGTPQTNQGSLCQSFRDLNWCWLALMGVSLGLAILAKGPIGFLMPMAIMGMHLLVTRRNQRDRYALLSVVNPFHFLNTTKAMRPVLLFSIAMLVALPWYLWVGLRTDGDFLRIFLLSENLGRSTEVFENHSGGVWFYPVALLIGFFPWSLFWLPLTIIGYRHFMASKIHPRSQDGIVLALCWIAVQIGIFSIARTKLPSYITPCYPGLAIVTAAYLHLWRNEKVVIGRFWMIAAMIVGVVVGLGLAVGAAIAVAKFFPQVAWLPAIGAVFTIFNAAGLLMIWHQRRNRMLISFSIGAICFCVLLFGFGTGSLSSVQSNRRILDRIATLPPTIAVASFECLESSWSFYSGRTIYETNRYVTPSSTQRTKFWKPKPVTTPESFAGQHMPCVFITTAPLAQTLLDRLPAGFAIEETADYRFKNKQLVLIGMTEDPSLSE